MNGSRDDKAGGLNAACGSNPENPKIPVSLAPGMPNGTFKGRRQAKNPDSDKVGREIYDQNSCFGRRAGH